MGLPWHNTQREGASLPCLLVKVLLAHGIYSLSKRRVKFLLDIHQPRLIVR